MSNAFDPTRDHRIPRNEASGLIQAFQAAAQPASHLASVFNRSAFDQLLAQPGAAGIRIYRAQHADGSPTFVMVGVDASGADLDGPDALCCQFTTDCPPYCPGATLANPL